jgi:hypothetical protein
VSSQLQFPANLFPGNNHSIAFNYDNIWVTYLTKDYLQRQVGTTIPTGTRIGGGRENAEGRMKRKIEI